jgi:N-acetylmuramoyl-L-alanine amidase
MSKYLYIFDPGHGGLVSGKYVTPGKRSPKFADGHVLYEGVNNRDNVSRLMTAFRAAGLDCIDIVNSQQDVPLSKRVADANKLAKTRKSVFISIHSDAAGDGVNWHPASGISVYSSKGQTTSDALASVVIDHLQAKFQSTVKWRFDQTDHDKDKEENFYVLAHTSMPAILCELGFHTNEAEAKRLLTPDWKDKVVSSLLAAVQAWEQKQ